MRVRVRVRVRVSVRVRVRVRLRPGYPAPRHATGELLRSTRVDLVAAERGEALGDAGVHEERVADVHADARAQQPRADRPIAGEGGGTCGMPTEGCKVPGCHVA